jgi:hypothetical protein
MPPSEQQDAVVEETQTVEKNPGASDAVSTKSKGPSRVVRWSLALSILLNVALLAWLALRHPERVPAPAPASVSAASTTHTKQDIDKSRSINVGMTGAAVKGLLGEPVVREIAANREEWHYCRTGETVDEYVAITFTGHKITALQYYTVRWLDLAFHYSAESDKLVGKTGAGDCRLTVRWGTYGQRTPSYPDKAPARMRIGSPLQPRRQASDRIAESRMGTMTPNRSFDTDTQRHCAARPAGERTPRGAMPLHAGQLRR